MQKVVFLIVSAILVVFTYAGFLVAPQPCDLDKVYLWCRLHPFSFGDLLGTVLFYAGGFCIAGLPSLLGFRLMGREGSIGKWPVIFFVATLAGAVLIWNT